MISFVQLVFFDTVTKLSLIGEHFDWLFSNSLLIHQIKTKNITAMEEVWIPGLDIWSGVERGFYGCVHAQTSSYVS